jgi:hypothetical protein
MDIINFCLFFAFENRLPKALHRNLYSNQARKRERIVSLLLENYVECCTFAFSMSNKTFNMIIYLAYMYIYLYFFN